MVGAPPPSSALARSLPAFLLSVFVLYWSLPIMLLSGNFCFFRMKGPRNDSYQWSWMMVKFFKVKLLRLGPNKLYKPTKGHILYLCNHRSWADFFLDLNLTQGNAALMSRWLVFYVFPVFMFAVRVLKGIVLFKRGHIADKKRFNEWLDVQLDASHVPGFLVYPEGHRSTKPTSLPLKRGMIHYAHSRGMPVQLIISKGKEDVLSEKRMAAHWGTTVVATFSQPIESKGLEFEAFAAQIQQTWNKLWTEAFAAPADGAGLTPLVAEGVPQFDYPLDMRRHMLVTTLGAALLMWLAIFAGGQALLGLTGGLGFWGQRVALWALGGWLAWSISSAHGPPRAAPPPPSLKPAAASTSVANGGVKHE